MISLPELLNQPWIASKILLAGNEDDGEATAEMSYFRDPLHIYLDDETRKEVEVTYLLLYVVQRVGRVDSEANEDNMRVRVTQRTKSVIIFLTSRIPQGQFDVFAVNINVGDVVFEHGGNIDLSMALVNL